MEVMMVRKITPTSGGWRKSFSTPDPHNEFEQSASRALATFRANSVTWPDTAIRKLTAPLTRHRLAPTMLAAFGMFARELVELEMPVVPDPMTDPREPIDAVAHRRQLRDMLTYTSHADRLSNEWLDGIAKSVGLIADRIPNNHGSSPGSAGEASEV
jgi:hypothetical protein